MSTITAETVRAPSARLLMLEARAAHELALAPLRLRRLHRELPAGDGHAVLVIPGFGAGDAATAAPLTAFATAPAAAFATGSVNSTTLLMGA